ncbi:MAG: TrkA family potassium uptake protein [Oscillospiraceae bacterium]|nr:TrkA family potassium uptake protein [Oscillospiraceae bacterium]
MAKSVLVIGIGAFGYFAALKYASEGNEVMAVDKYEDNVNLVMNKVTSVQIGDCTNPAVLRALGADNFDICVVAVSSDFQASLEITSLLKDMGAPYVIAKANREIQEKFLLRNGADEVVYPDREIANELAVRTSQSRNIFDSIELGSEYSIYETPVPEMWTGRTILQLDIRRKYHLNVLGIKSDGILMPMPDVNYAFRKGEHIMLLGKRKDISKLFK